MAQFDVHQLPDGGWVVDIQSDLIAISQTRAVIPLVAPDEDAIAIRRLHPLLDVNGERRVLATHLLGVVRCTVLSEPIGSVAADEYAVKGAIDMLISGY